MYWNFRGRQAFHIVYTQHREAKGSIGARVIYKVMSPGWLSRPSLPTSMNHKPKYGMVEIRHECIAGRFWHTMGG